MTYAWYGHLNKDTNHTSMIKLIFICWGIAFLEYIFMVPANNYFAKMEGFKPFQLKVIQEIISLTIFFLFAMFYLKIGFRWNYLVAFLCVLGAVYFMFLPQKQS